MRYMRRNNWADSGECASVIRHSGTYREHAHRAIMLPPDYWLRRDTTDEAFWPTCRGRSPMLPAPIVNCQRCGKEIPMNSGWWCQHCHGVARWLQRTRCWSMVQIAAMGEYDPPWAEWVQDVPWMLWRRIELPRITESEWRECPACKRSLPPESFAEQGTRLRKVGKHADSGWCLDCRPIQRKRRSVREEAA